MGEVEGQQCARRCRSTTVDVIEYRLTVNISLVRQDRVELVSLVMGIDYVERLDGAAGHRGSMRAVMWRFNVVV